jgi:hypothetical protein
MVDPLALRRFEFLFGVCRTSTNGTGKNGIRNSFFESALFDVEER